MKKVKDIFRKSGNLFIFCGVFCAVLFFVYTTSANTPDGPFGQTSGTTIQVCTDPPYATFDFSNNGFIYFTTAGNSIGAFWTKVFSDADRTNLIHDSGVIAVSYVYRIDLFSSPVSGWQIPSCPCDADSATQDCVIGDSPYPVGSPDICYDRYQGETCYGWGPYMTCIPTNWSRKYVKTANGDSGLPGTRNYRVSSALVSEKKTYYYKIAAQNNSPGEWTPWATGVLCNHPPTPVPQASVQPDYCVVDSPSVTLAWAFTDAKIGGDTLSAYQVQISEFSNFSTILVDSGKVSSGSNTSFATSAITWNKTYYWRVKIWDSCNSVSNYDNWTNGPSFSTITHPKPRPNFSWFPLNPAPDETVLFRDESVAYGGYGIADSRAWTFQDSTMVRPHEISPIVKFDSIGSKTVTLTATDTSPEAFTCTASKTVSVGTGAPSNSNLPCWREINPH